MKSAFRLDVRSTGKDTSRQWLLGSQYGWGGLLIALKDPGYGYRSSRFPECQLWRKVPATARRSLCCRQTSNRTQVMIRIQRSLQLQFPRISFFLTLRDGVRPMLQP